MELVAKGQPIEFGTQRQKEWQIVKPRPQRADNGQVEELVRKLTDARMDTSRPLTKSPPKGRRPLRSADALPRLRLTDAPARTH